MKETFADMMEKIQMKKETVTEARTATVSNSPFRSSWKLVECICLINLISFTSKNYWPN